SGAASTRRVPRLPRGIVTHWLRGRTSPRLQPVPGREDEAQALRRRIRRQRSQTTRYLLSRGKLGRRRERGAGGGAARGGRRARLRGGGRARQEVLGPPPARSRLERRRRRRPRPRPPAS